jgi:hypothetical protein
MGLRGSYCTVRVAYFKNWLSLMGLERATLHAETFATSETPETLNLSPRYEALQRAAVTDHQVRALDLGELPCFELCEDARDRLP